MTRELVIVGAGGLGREVLDIVEACNRAQPDRYRVLGIVDDAPSAVNVGRVAAREVPMLGTVTEWAAERTGADCVIAIGDPAARARVHLTLGDSARRSPELVHPTATLGSLVRIGPGAIVGAGVQVSSNVEIGEHVYLGTGCIIGHDVTLRPFATVLPGAVVSGDVTLGAASVVGARAVVLQGRTVGAHATVGAAACVTRDVARSTIVKGVPAR